MLPNKFAIAAPIKPNVGMRRILVTRDTVTSTVLIITGLFDFSKRNQRIAKGVMNKSKD